MIVLLEGADGTGKTTLAQQLKQAYGLKYLHFGVPDEHPMDYWFKTLSEICEPTVIDRLHLSEEAYGPVFRDGSQLTPLQFWLIEGWLYARATLLVMCSTSWERMKDNQAKVEGPYHDERQTQVVENFMGLAAKTSLPLLIHDYAASTSRLLVNASIPNFVRWADKIKWDEMGVGALRPSVWLVGDQPNPRGATKEHLRHLPFLSTSGEYLRRALTYTGLADWSLIHLSNARDRAGEANDLHAKWEELGTPPVVALGNVASKELTTAEVPHQKVPHPQWWRRFKHHSVEQYGEEIRNAYANG